MKRLLMCVSLGIFALASMATAGENEGYTVSVQDASTVQNPEIGDVITVVVQVDSTTRVKGYTVKLAYDPDVITFQRFAQGTLLSGNVIGFPGAPVVGEDGLARIEGGVSILGSGESAIQVTTGGILGTFHLQVSGELTEAGSFLSVVEVVLNTSSGAEAKDTVQPDLEQIGRRLTRRFPNQIFNVDVQRRFDGAALAWESRFPGLADTVRVRATGDSVWQSFGNPTLASTDTTLLQAASLLLAAGVTLGDTIAPAADALLTDAGIDVTADGFSDALLRLARQLRTRRHVVQISGLAADTQFDYRVVSISLNDQQSNSLTGNFRTRQAPDLRPAIGIDLDVQTAATTASASWFTNRPADTQLLVTEVASGDTVVNTTLDADGSLVHAALAQGLTPETQYAYIVTSRLVGVDDLLAQELLTEQQMIFTKTGTFRTRAIGRPLRFLVPPARVVSSNNAVITVRLNQIAGAIIDYGVVTEEEGSARAAAMLQDTTAELYTETLESTDILNTHALTLTDLDPATRYRYRLRLATPDGDTLSTDPRGNRQWSRDLKLRTSAEGDTLPPVIVEGPVVISRDVLAIIRFVTDVDTRATVFFGTSGGTYGTADEFEFADKTADGSLRLAQEHAITISGLDAGAAYEYGIVVEATNGRTASFEPSLGAGKSTAALQPPGGAGAFTTNNQPDTQFPVILAGPTIASKTHETAIIEWVTDEPADAQVSFGVEDLGDNEGSGVNETTHKLVLSNLDPGQTYSYVVESTDASGNGATESSTSTFTTNPEVDLTAPQIASAPEVIYKNNEVATIQWTTNEDATGEVTFGDTEDDLGFVRTITSTGRVHEVSLTNLTAGTTYFYQASSTDLSNNGPTQSDVVSFTTDALADETLPIISEVAALAADSSAILTWTTDEVADSFVDFGTISGILDVTVGDVSDVTTHEVTLTNLDPGTTYYYTVGSIDRAGNGPTETAQDSFVTPLLADTQPPQIPSQLAGTAGSAQVVLNWGANAEVDLAGYNIYRRLAGADSFDVIASLVAEAGYLDPGLVNDAEYEYQVTALDRSTPPNESDASAILSVFPTQDAAPTAPSDLSVSGEVLQPTLSFTDAEPFALGATLTYTIQVSTQSDFSDVTASTSGLPGLGSQTQWTISRELDDGSTYYWRVRAVEGDLIGPFTAAQEFKASTAPLLPGDFDDSGFVDFDDFFAFIDNFGKPYAESSAYDVDGSGGGIIDFDDFFAFIDNFGSRAAGKSWGFAHRLDDQAQIWLEAQASLMGAEVGSPGHSDGVDDDIRVRVWIDEATKLSAFGLVLGYDPSLLQFESAQEGAGHLLESQGGHTDLFSVLHQRPGVLLIGNGLTAGDPVDGKGLLAELSFRLMDRRRANEAVIALREAFVANGAENVRRVMSLQGTGLQPASFALSQAYPNPFNPSTQIEFALAQDTPARLVIYDVLGQRVRTLVRGDDGLGAGFYTVTWDGTNAHGAPVGNGLYFYRLETPAFQRTGKMMMIK
jgi:hypothetical protein